VHRRRAVKKRALLGVECEAVERRASQPDNSTMSQTNDSASASIARAGFAITASCTAL
jgi:hypothetical protein